jgi:hypothetical protein
MRSDQIRDTVRQGLSLAATGTGLNQQWPIGGLHGSALFRI